MYELLSYAAVLVWWSFSGYALALLCWAVGQGQQVVVGLPDNG